MVNFISIANIVTYRKLDTNKKIMVMDAIVNLARKGFVVIVPKEISIDIKNYRIAKMLEGGFTSEVSKN